MLKKETSTGILREIHNYVTNEPYTQTLFLTKKLQALEEAIKRESSQANVRLLILFYAFADMVSDGEDATAEYQALKNYMATSNLERYLSGGEVASIDEYRLKQALHPNLDPDK